MTLELTEGEADLLVGLIWGRLEVLGDPQPAYYTPQRYVELRDEVNSLNSLQTRLLT